MRSTPPPPSMTAQVPRPLKSEYMTALGFPFVVHDDPQVLHGLASSFAIAILCRRKYGEGSHASSTAARAHRRILPLPRCAWAVFTLTRCRLHTAVLAPLLPYGARTGLSSLAAGATPLPSPHCIGACGLFPLAAGSAATSHCIGAGSADTVTAPADVHGCCSGGGRGGGGGGGAPSSCVMAGCPTSSCCCSCW